MKNNQYKFYTEKDKGQELLSSLIHEGIESCQCNGNDFIVNFKMDSATVFISAYEYVVNKIGVSKSKVKEISKSARSFSFDVEPSIATPIFRMIKDKYSRDVKIKRSKDHNTPSRITVPISLVSTIYEGMSLSQKIQQLINEFRTPHLLKQIGSQLDRECPMYKTHDFPTIKGSEMIAKGILQDGKGNKIYPDKKYFDDDAEKVKLPKKVQLKSYYTDKVLETYYAGEEEIIKVGGWNKVYEVVDQAYIDAAHRRQQDTKTKFMESPLNPGLLKSFGLLPSDRVNVFMGHGSIISLSEEFGVGIKKAMPFLNNGVVQYNYSNSSWVHEGAMTNQLVSDYSDDVVTAKKMLDIGYTVNVGKSKADFIYMDGGENYAIFRDAEFAVYSKGNDYEIFNDKHSFLVIKECNNLLTEKVLKWMGFKTVQSENNKSEKIHLSGCDIYIDVKTRNIVDIHYGSGEKRLKEYPLTVKQFVQTVEFKGW